MFGELDSHWFALSVINATRLKKWVGLGRKFKQLVHTHHPPTPAGGRGCEQVWGFASLIIKPMSFQAYLDNIKAKTGKTPEDFKKAAEKAGC